MPDHERPHRAGLWVGVFILLLLGLGSYRLGEPGLLVDENTSYQIAALPLTEIPGQLRQNDPHPPLYAYLLHFWLRFGDEEWKFRLPSLLFGLLCLPLLYLVARPVAGSHAALLAMALLSVNSLFLFSCRLGRMYALFLLLMLASQACYQAWLKRGGGLRWLLLLLANLALLYTHYFAFWVIGFQTAWFFCLLLGPWGSQAGEARTLVHPEMRNRIRAYFGLLLALGILCLPLWVAMTGALGRSFPVNVPDLSPSFFLGAFRDLLVWPYLEGGAIALWVALLTTGFFLAGLVRILAGRSPWGVYHALFFSVSFVAIPLLLRIVENNYSPRFLLPALPSFVIMSGLGIQTVAQGVSGLFRRGGRWARRVSALRAAPAIGFLLLAVPCALGFRAQGLFVEDYAWKEAGRFLASHVRPGDVVILTGLDAHAVPYYLRRTSGYDIHLSNQPETLLEICSHYSRRWMVLTRLAPRLRHQEPFLQETYDTLHSFLHENFSQRIPFGGSENLWVGFSEGPEHGSVYGAPRTWQFSAGADRPFFDALLGWLNLEPKEYRDRMLAVPPARTFQAWAARRTSGKITMVKDAGGKVYGTLGPGSWVEFVVDIRDTGDHRILVHLRARHPKHPPTLTLSGTVQALQPAGPVEQWETIPVRAHLPAGRQTLRIEVPRDGPSGAAGGAGCDLAWVRIEGAEAVPRSGSSPLGTIHLHGEVGPFGLRSGWVGPGPPSSGLCRPLAVSSARNG